MLENIEEGFHLAVHCGIFVLEVIGVIILFIYAFRALKSFFSPKNRAKQLLSEGITTSLSFLLGGEVLKTIIAPDWKDIGMTCAILLMRAAVTVLLYWEHKSEMHEG